jgi:penicillin-binding protein 1A
VGSAAAVGCGIAAIVYMSSIERDLPDYAALASYMPPVKSRLYAANGEVIAEFASEPRLFLPIQAVPERVKAAFISAEDKNFYQHSGLDFTGVMRAVGVNLANLGSNRRMVGASTITQQVAKNLLLTSDQTMTRKLKEALLSLRMESGFSKDRILELYLNQIFLGQRSYGIAQATLTYFGKAVGDLSVAEAAYLAALPKGPANYNPFVYPDAAIERRNWVIDRMADNGYITPDDAELEKRKPLGVSRQPSPTRFAEAGYFIDNVRQTMLDQLGEKGLYEGGYSIRTTLDPHLQREARRALQHALLVYDEQRGYRGPLDHIDIDAYGGEPLTSEEPDLGVPGWTTAVVSAVGADGLDLTLRSGGEPKAHLDPAGMKWALGKRKLTDILKRGDVIIVERQQSGELRLRQFPKVQGALVSMQPQSGRVVAMVGGFSYGQSQFNRATQAFRQPGSVFKPIVYAAALDNGFSPATVIRDEPVEFRIGDQAWSPRNDGNHYEGPVTLRFGVEHSRNVMAAKLASVVGMDTVMEYAERLGIYAHRTPVLSMSLGSGETTLMRIVAAYSVIANGGLQVTPSLIDRTQDRTGKTIYRQDQRICVDCNAETWKSQNEPELVDTRERVLDPMTAYQIISMMEGVVKRGTASRSVKLGRPVAGKTGTTNENHDAWFVGFTPELVTGVYIGFDEPHSLGRAGSGGGLAAPVFNDFMTVALSDIPASDFHMPQGMTEYTIDRRTGMLTSPDDPDSLLEAFKPGSGPADFFSTIDDAERGGALDSPQARSVQDRNAVGLF